MLFNATFNTIIVISWRSVLLMEETGKPEENHRPVASNWRTLKKLDMIVDRVDNVHPWQDIILKKLLLKAFMVVIGW
jgi:hypothetical protein